MSGRRTLIENVASLSVLQAANYLLPLITLPYLIRVLGPETFGLIVFAQAFIQYFMMLVDYGFNLTATRQIAIHRENLEKVSEIFSVVMFVKFCLLLASFFLMSAIVFAVPMFREDWQVYFVTFIAVVGIMLFPIWFFQGMEKMKHITVLNVVSRTVATIAVFAFVRDQSDYLLAAGLQSGGIVLAGVIGIWAVRRLMPIRLIPPSLREVVATLRDGWHVFVSQISVSLVGNSSVFILGLFQGNLIVGYYSVAYKIIIAASGLSIPLVSAIYPRVNALFTQGRALAIEFLRKVLIFGGATFMVVSIGLFLGADLAVRLVAGEANDSISMLVRIMAVIPFFSFVDNIYGTQILLALGMNKQFMNAILYSGVFAVVGSLILASTLGGVGSAIVLTASQALTMLLMVKFAHREGVKILGNAP